MTQTVSNSEAQTSTFLNKLSERLEFWNTKSFEPLILFTFTTSFHHFENETASDRSNAFHTPCTLPLLSWTLKSDHSALNSLPPFGAQLLTWVFLVPPIWFKHLTRLHCDAGSARKSYQHAWSAIRGSSTPWPAPCTDEMHMHLRWCHV